MTFDSSSFAAARTLRRTAEQPNSRTLLSIPVGDNWTTYFAVPKSHKSSPNYFPLHLYVTGEPLSQKVFVTDTNEKLKGTKWGTHSLSNEQAGCRKDANESDVAPMTA